ncbi:MAG TPA: hypothetical protein VMF06_05815 [Candidatus Limnocylindria bacterium]|jgi:hypothetical protein|nr:hypothetical protein [Candidatus Limnocylindria bacterium]
MKRFLRVAAVAVAILSAGLWLGLGANRGWTKTQQQVRTLDPVTGLESVDYRAKFSPGLELLALGLAGAAGLAALSFLFRPTTKNNI